MGQICNLQEIGAILFYLSCLFFLTLEKLGSLTVEVEKIALTEKKQKLKLAIILKTVSECLQREESEVRWSVDGIYRT